MEELKKKILQFRDERDWKQFHTIKDLLLGIGIETAELQEIFHWKSEEEIEKTLTQDPSYLERIKEECGDVLNYLILISERFDFDLLEAAKDKLLKNAQKYPVEIFRGKNIKYDQR